MRTHGPTQRRVRRAWRLAALLSALALVAAACGDDDDDTEAGDENGDDTTTTAAAADEAIAEFQESGVTIGFADEDPFAFEDAEGNVTGEAPEVAAAVFERLDIEITDAQAVEFDGLIPGLNAGQYDVIAAGMFINPERAENVLFSNPDYCSGTAFAVPEGNPNDLNDFQDIVDNPDVTLGVLSGAVEEGFAEDNGVPGGQLETLASRPAGSTRWPSPQSRSRSRPRPARGSRPPSSSFPRSTACRRPSAGAMGSTSTTSRCATPSTRNWRRCRTPARSCPSSRSSASRRTWSPTPRRRPPTSRPRAPPTTWVTSPSGADEGNDNER